jgi:hypothetical protein
MLKQYGVDNPFKIPQIKEKINRLKFNKTYESFSKFA